ncbi:MAG: HAD-IA family hydrolase [archaeon]|nr:HAD-IA family hydrolase [archaeon]
MGGVLADNLHWYQGWGEGTFDKDLEKQVEKARLAAWYKIRDDPTYPVGQFWGDVLTAAGLTSRFTPEECNEILISGFRPYYGTLALAQRLSGRGYTIAICSNHAKEWFEEIMARFRVADIFSKPDLVLASYAAGCSKPTPEMFNMVLERLRVHHPGLLPEEVVLVDDQKKNTTAAASFGMRAILFDAAVQPPLDLVNALHDLGVVSREQA